MNVYVLSLSVDVEFGSQPSLQSRYPLRELAEAAAVI